MLQLKQKINSNERLERIVKSMLKNEFHSIKDNTLLFNLVLYRITQKDNTVQNVKNVLSCIKDNAVKENREVSFRKEEVRIKCSI